MFRIKTMNSISPAGIEALTARGCDVSADEVRPEALLLRSAELHGCEFNPELLAIGRAGAGYNNIPIPDCTEHGIVVFNSPGANAEAVKELELCSLVMASRDVLGSIGWVRGISGEGAAIPKLVEKGKSAFAGPELLGKTLGVIGLGAVGALVANIALELGMTVYGYDPFMSVDAAWRLSREVLRADSVDDIFRNSDYISINVPYTEQTHHMLNAEAFAKMKRGVRIVNESRAEPNVIAMPHLGACTPESEDRCAVMAANQLYDYLLNGNIKNSVNLPDTSLSRMGVCRLCVIHRNVPRMITRILDFISDRNINVEHMINKPRDKYAYTIVDLGASIGEDIADSIRAMDNVLRVRVI